MARRTKVDKYIGGDTTVYTASKMRKTRSLSISRSVPVGISKILGFEGFEYKPTSSEVVAHRTLSYSKYY